MRELTLEKVLSISPEKAVQRPLGQAGPVADFQGALRKATDEMNQLLVQADQARQEMALGKVDIHTAMIATEKASISFRLMMQVRNKMLTAYEEIMRMQF